jgi:hypothetical protein
VVVDSYGAGSYGIEVERRRREISAYHGVPDFVFRPLDVHKGSRKREVGDFLLWVGSVVAIVSHKSREPSAAARESQRRRRSWLAKNIKEGYGQIIGVARNLRSLPPGEIVLESERGVQVPWDPTLIDMYVGAVVVDAPEPDDDYAPPVMNEGVPTIAMLASDWDQLNGLLPSTSPVIEYLALRQACIPRAPLGAELDVLALVLEHENTGDPINNPDGGLSKDHFERTRTAHPEWFLGSHPDDRFAFVIDAMIEGAADADPEGSDTTEPLNYLQFVEFLDRIPLLSRVTIGKDAINRCQHVGREGGRSTGRAALPHGMLIFLTDEHQRAERAEYLRGVTFARHSQALDAGAPTTLTTLGVATQPIPSGDGRAHDFVFIHGGIRSDPEFRQRRDELFGAPDMAPFVARWDADA